MMKLRCTSISSNGSPSKMFQTHNTKKTKLPWLSSVSELYRPSDRRLSKLVPTFAETRGQRNGTPWPLISVF
jgi:hypothetical protein